ncbi:3-hydroxyacyl-CoA dehydrogenase NAD-binding domain-containing protein [Aquamicrobium sp. LC103]|uniref:3-hydroxyacyl-CoA dehydrogenase NAD-binding domain-containing protein n=1 Tax=Aquamicrobium sp. LC103 TaxID=1120658 RepID=UPI00063EB60A|nr:3-hydroxyacyl-CoA dehydrogenase NAD-binding domain-containing protein [Aquamicrobium sp. LC103]TKT74786.1 3-hydroxyacyl-CoA dehydrogenase [Aquamicrobium sp. LC103]
MTEGVVYEVNDGIAVLRVDNPPVNALSPHVRLALNELIRKADEDPAIRGVVLTGTGKVFVAGADIKLINMPRTGPTIGDFLAHVEGMRKPVVAAVQGTALGGGFEIALGCHARVALAGNRVGLPEATLGLIPGAGGTQRLPRLVGAAVALEMIVSGRHLEVEEALRLGAVDAVVEDDLLGHAFAWVDRLLARSLLPRARDRQPSGDMTDIEAARTAFDCKAAELGTNGTAATQAAIAAVADSFDRDFDEALAREIEAFTRLRTSPVAQARIHAFLAERAARHVPGVKSDTPRRPVDTVAVIGAGTMGAGIAITLANAGYAVCVVDAAVESLDAARTRINTTYGDLVGRGRMSAGAAETARARLRWFSDLAEGVAEADLVIEAVYEDMDLKKRIFAELSRLAPDHAILASNTSYQDIDALARETARPERVVGMHYFSPANVMKLLEVVRGAATSPQTLASVLDIARRTGKIPVVVGVCYGFVGNRMLWQRTVQTQKLLLEGCSPREIDTVLTNFGFRMGPCQMQDLAGIDVAWRLRKARGERMEPVDTIADAGRWGQKTGKGYYLYPEGVRTGVDDPELLEIVAGVAGRLKVPRRRVGGEEIRKRLLFPLINEGFRIVEEGMVERPGDIDVVYLHGYGWPRDKGGPMHHAETYGLKRLADDLDRMAETLGEEELRPTRFLRELADTGGSLAEIDART